MPKNVFLQSLTALQAFKCSYTSYDTRIGLTCHTFESQRDTSESIVRHTTALGMTQYVHHSIPVALTGVKEECFEGLCTHRWAFGSNTVPHTDCHRECMLPQNSEGTQGEPPLAPGHTAVHSAFQSHLVAPFSLCCGDSFRIAPWRQTLSPCVPSRAAGHFAFCISASLSTQHLSPVAVLQLPFVFAIAHCLSHGLGVHICFVSSQVKLVTVVQPTWVPPGIATQSA